MSFLVKQEYNKDYTITIEPNKEYKYLRIDSLRSGTFFIQIDKNNMGKIITVKGIDTKSYDMKDFWTYPDNNVTLITKKTVLTLPSKAKYEAENN